MRICGPKLSICGLVLSAWGVLMLALLGVFFKVHSVALIDDLSIDKEKMANVTPPQYIRTMNTEYVRNAYSCWTAACLYIITFAVSLHQYFTNRRSHVSI